MNQAFVNPLWSKDRRRVFRAVQTKIEELLWEQLRGRRCGGVKFRRQVGLGPYIVDFYSHEIKIAVEVDGPVHDDPAAREYDAIRDGYLKEAGVVVLRFTNDQVSDTMSEVLLRIRSAYLSTKWRG